MIKRVKPQTGVQDLHWRLSVAVTEEMFFAVQRRVRRGDAVADYLRQLITDDINSATADKATITNAQQRGPI